ncbi:MAG: hypothetical protein OXB88_03740 [Bacteriovoracales bacterium]|nr:hypothetical protein [Bacteriovoracales bacterium]
MLKVLGPCLLFVFSQICFASWNLHKKYDDVSIYKSKKGTRLTVRSSASESRGEKFTKDLLKKLKKDKEKMLAMIGVEDWKISKTNLKTTDGVTSVRLAGSYMDKTQKIVHFVEYHYYSNDKKLQLLLTNRSKGLVERDSKPSNIKRFRNEHSI